MSNGGSTDGRASTNDRRVAARDKARKLRQKQRKRDRRNRVFVQGGIAVAVVAVLAVVAVVIVGSIHPASPGPANMASDGIVIGNSLKAERTGSLQPDATPKANKPDQTGTTVNIVTYVDYLCPYCGQFERTNSAQIGKLVETGAATLEIHPIPLLMGHSSGTKYSLRATNAAACVAQYDPDGFFAFNTALFAHQPVENTPGPTNAQIKKRVAASGVSHTASVAKCIDEGRYNSWAQDALDRALAGPIPNSTAKKLTGTPLVLVNGQQYKGSLTDADEFRSFIVKAQADTYSTDSPSAAPTPTSTATATP